MPPKEYKKIATDYEKVAYRMAERSSYSSHGPSQGEVARQFENAGDAWEDAKDYARAIKCYQVAAEWIHDSKRKKMISEKISKLNKPKLSSNKLAFGFFKKGLESKVSAIISIAALLISLLSLSMGLTGYSIFGINELNSRNFSIFFFIFGLIFAFLYLNRKKKMKKKK